MGLMQELFGNMFEPQPALPVRPAPTKPRSLANASNVTANAVAVEESALLQGKIDSNVATLVKNTAGAFRTVTDHTKRDKPYPVSKTVKDLMDQRKLYSDVNLEDHAERLDFEIRCQQAKDAGFNMFKNIEEAIQFFVGMKYIKAETRDNYTSREQGRYSWFYDHICDKMWPRDHTVNIVDYTMPDGNTLTKGPVNCLAQPIPRGPLLLMKEAMDSKLFNCFDVIAPIDMWKQFEIIVKDPILLGVIVGTMDSVKGFRVEKRNYFFLAKWF